MEQTISTMVTNYLSQSDEKNFEKLLERFQPLTRKYAKKLYYLEFENSLQELNLAIYEAVSQLTYIKNEYACISYIKKAVFHKFCKLYATSEVEQQKRENQICYDDHICQSEDILVKDSIFYLDLEKELETMCLVKKQIIHLLLEGYTDKEIGEQLHCSRQYVNRVKKSIFKSENA